MADDDDAAEYRRLLSEVLRGHGFGWVVDQFEMQISEGRPSSKQVSEREPFSPESDPFFTIRTPRRRRASLITSEPYTEEERLEIVVNAIDAALIQRASLETEVLDMLADIGPSVSSISFLPDVVSRDPESSSLGKPHRVDSDRRGAASSIRVRTEGVLLSIRGRNRAGTS